MAIVKEFSRYGEELLDVKKILKQRKERFRINDSIFEDRIADKDAVIDANSNGSEKDNNKCDKNLVPAKVQKIDFKRRGVDIFHDVTASQLFDEDSLYDEYVKSKPNNHPIFSLSKEELYQNILKGLLKQKMKMQDIVNHVSKFLFFVMSGHSSNFLIEACFETLRYSVQNFSKSEDLRPWTPFVDDIKSVFVGYGASKEILSLNDVSIPLEITLKEENIEYSPERLSPRNIFWVFKFMHLVLSHCKNIYSIEELDQLLIMFLIVSLDKYFVHRETHNYVLIAKCSHRILDAYPDLGSKEDEKISKIGKMIYTKLMNINTNELHFIINLCVSNPILGNRLGQAISYSMINHRVQSLKHVSHFYEVKSKDIKRILSGDRLRAMDYHSQFYILMILDRCITSMIFTKNHQAHLAPFSNLLSHVKINLPDDDDAIDYHFLKELITRMSALWKLSIAEMV